VAGKDPVHGLRATRLDAGDNRMTDWGVDCDLQIPSTL